MQLQSRWSLKFLWLSSALSSCPVNSLCHRLWSLALGELRLFLGHSCHCWIPQWWGSLKLLGWWRLVQLSETLSRGEMRVDASCREIVLTKCDWGSALPSIWTISSEMAQVNSAEPWKTYDACKLVLIRSTVRRVAWPSRCTSFKVVLIHQWYLSNYQSRFASLWGLFASLWGPFARPWDPFSSLWGRPAYQPWFLAWFEVPLWGPWFAVLKLQQGDLQILRFPCWIIRVLEQWPGSWVGLSWFRWFLVC